MTQVKVIIIIMQLITIQFAVRVRKDYTPLLVYLGCVWVVIYVKYITYEDLLHNTLALDVDTVQEVCVFTANLRLTYEKALCEWFRNLSKRNVVRARPLPRNGNFLKNAVIKKKIAVTSKTIQLHIFRGL